MSVPEDQFQKLVSLYKAALGSVEEELKKLEEEGENPRKKLRDVEAEIKKLEEDAKAKQSKINAMNAIEPDDDKQAQELAKAKDTSYSIKAGILAEAEKTKVVDIVQLRKLVSANDKKIEEHKALLKKLREVSKLQKSVVFFNNIEHGKFIKSCLVQAEDKARIIKAGDIRGKNFTTNNVAVNKFVTLFENYYEKQDFKRHKKNQLKRSSAPIKKQAAPAMPAQVAQPVKPILMPNKTPELELRVNELMVQVAKLEQEKQKLTKQLEVQAEIELRKPIEPKIAPEQEKVQANLLQKELDKIKLELEQIKRAKVEAEKNLEAEKLRGTRVDDLNLNAARDIRSLAAELTKAQDAKKEAEAKLEREIERLKAAEKHKPEDVGAQAVKLENLSADQQRLLRENLIHELEPKIEEMFEKSNEEQSQIHRKELERVRDEHNAKVELLNAEIQKLKGMSVSKFDAKSKMELNKQWVGGDGSLGLKESIKNWMKETNKTIEELERNIKEISSASELTQEAQAELDNLKKQKEYFVLKVKEAVANVKEISEDLDNKYQGLRQETDNLAWPAIEDEKIEEFKIKLEALEMMYRQTQELCNSGLRVWKYGDSSFLDTLASSTNNLNKLNQNNESLKAEITRLRKLDVEKNKERETQRQEATVRLEAAAAKARLREEALQVRLDKALRDIDIIKGQFTTTEAEYIGLAEQLASKTLSVEEQVQINKANQQLVSEARAKLAEAQKIKESVKEDVQSLAKELEEVKAFNESLQIALRQQKIQPPVGTSLAEQMVDDKDEQIKTTEELNELKKAQKQQLLLQVTAIEQLKAQQKLELDAVKITSGKEYSEVINKILEGHKRELEKLRNEFQEQRNAELIAHETELKQKLEQLAKEMAAVNENTTNMAVRQAQEAADAAHMADRGLLLNKIDELKVQLAHLQQQNQQKLLQLEQEKAVQNQQPTATRRVEQLMEKLLVQQHKFESLLKKEKDKDKIKLLEKQLQRNKERRKKLAISEVRGYVPVRKVRRVTPIVSRPAPAPVIPPPLAPASASSSSNRDNKYSDDIPAAAVNKRPRISISTFPGPAPAKPGTLTFYEAAIRRSKVKGQEKSAAPKDFLLDENGWKSLYDGSKQSLDELGTLGNDQKKLSDHMQSSKDKEENIQIKAELYRGCYLHGYKNSSYDLMRNNIAVTGGREKLATVTRDKIHHKIDIVSEQSNPDIKAVFLMLDQAHAIYLRTGRNEITISDCEHSPKIAVLMKKLAEEMGLKPKFDVVTQKAMETKTFAFDPQSYDPEKDPEYAKTFNLVNILHKPSAGSQFSI